MKNKILLIIVGVLAISSLFIFLIFKQEQVPSTLNEPNKKLTIWVEDPSSERDSYFTYMAERFTRQNPSLDVDLKFIPGSSQKSYNYITTEILNKNAPDVILTSLETYNHLACDHQLYSLNSYINGFDSLYFLSNAISNSTYQNNMYGIAYHLDPEILVYRKDFLSSIDFPMPGNFESLGDFDDYLSRLNDIYGKDQLDKIPFSIPTLISKSDFYSSFLNDRTFARNAGDIATFNADLLSSPLDLLKNMHNKYDNIPYDSTKISTHPFFNGQSAVALEPLSLVYDAIGKDKNLLKKINIVPIDASPLKFSYSNNRYISIINHTEVLAESLEFLDFFFTEEEVWNRYTNMNLPIVINSLKEDFLLDTRFDNTNIINYVEEAFHHKVSLDMPLFLKSLDELYEETLHK